MMARYGFLHTGLGIRTKSRFRARGLSGKSRTEPLGSVSVSEQPQGNRKLAGPMTGRHGAAGSPRSPMRGPNAKAYKQSQKLCLAAAWPSKSRRQGPQWGPPVMNIGSLASFSLGGGGASAYPARYGKPAPVCSFRRVSTRRATSPPDLPVTSPNRLRWIVDPHAAG